MKILWVNPSFLDYRIPVYKRLYELTGGNFYILFSKKRVSERICLKIQEAIGVNAICFEGEKRIIFGEKEGMSNKWMSFPITKGLYKRIKKIDADIVIAEGFFQWTPQAVRYVFFHRKPLLIEYERTKHTERSCPKWRMIYRKLVDQFVSGYLCNGKLTKEYLFNEMKIKKDNLFVGGMSADSEGLVSAIQSMSVEECITLRNKLNINNSGIVYIYVGQLIERKGVIYLLNAWKKHIRKYNQDNLLIVGGGDLYDSFVDKFGNEVSIHFTNGIDYDNIYKYYAISDVFIIPTLEDNWSLVVPEAMACGLPIACSIYNGCYPELVHEGENGKLFDPLKQETVIEALDTFHRVDLQKYGEYSRKIEKYYNHERTANNIYAACVEVLNRNNK